MTDSVTAAAERLAQGESVLITTTGTREYSAYLTLAANAASASNLLSLTRAAGGYFVVAGASVLEPLHISLERNSGAGGPQPAPAFCESVDLIAPDPHSFAGQAATVRALGSVQSQPGHFKKPGIIRPLRAFEGGVLRRPGLPEAATDLVTLAGLAPVAVIGRLLGADGRDLSPAEAGQLAEQRSTATTSVTALIHHRRQSEKLIERQASAEIPTPWGTFQATAFRDSVTGDDHLAMVYGQLQPGAPTLVRVHDECLTGDVFESLRCDCGPQLKTALQQVAAEGCGVVLYMRQEGRGIGLANKLQAYALQQQDGLDTVDANIALGFAADERDYGIGAQILAEMGVTKLRLLTNNPRKRSEIAGYGLEIVEQVKLQIEPNEHNAAYMSTKKHRLGHDVIERDS